MLTIVRAIGGAATGATASTLLGAGAGVALHDAGYPVVFENVVFTKNRARGGEGGALLIEASSDKNATTVQILNSRFEDNRAETYGGAISIGNLLPACILVSRRAR